MLKDKIKILRGLFLLATFSALIAACLGKLYYGEKYEHNLFFSFSAFQLQMQVF